MAEVQESFPVTGQPFTDAAWRAILGDEAGIVGDTNGTAFSIQLPSGSDIAEVGSNTIDSVARVGGFGLRIPQGTTQSVTIPPSTNIVGRTDIVAVRYDPALSATTPTRLVRIAGTEGSVNQPAVDEGPPGVEVLPLWAITRNGNGTTAEGLNQAAKADLRVWTGTPLLVNTGRALPTNVPIGTRARRGGSEYVRELVGVVAEWTQTAAPIVSDTSFGSSTSGWTTSATQNQSTLIREGRRRTMYLEQKRTASSDIEAGPTSGHIGNTVTYQITATDAPTTPVVFGGMYFGTPGADYTCTGYITTDGDVTLACLTPGVALAGDQDAAGLWSLRLSATWYVA